MQDILRFITCGSVDNGKSTLIGRMLYDSNMVPEDHAQDLKSTSKKFGTTGNDLDFALLVDGLEAEFEQGITIDIAYRYFNTPKRKFIIADTPGHVQYTKNMATAASTADLAIILIDASQGITEQTKRHSYIVSMLGVKQVIVAVNKMDLMDYSHEYFKETSYEYLRFAKELNFTNIDIIPVCALTGENVCKRSLNMSWYKKKTLLNLIETTEAPKQAEDKDNFRMPVQMVTRHNSDFRGFAGTITSGQINKGDDIVVLPSKKTSKVKSIITYNEELNTASSKQAITLTLEDEIDVSSNDLISSVENQCPTADIFKSKILWLSEEPLVAHRQYIFKSASSEQTCTLEKPKYIIDVESFNHIAEDRLELNDIGVCSVYLNQKCAYETYENNRSLGSFILIDRYTNQTIAMGMIDHSMRRSSNVHLQKTSITQEERSKQKEQTPYTIWMTGLSGSGKSTIANVLEKNLFEKGYHTIILDGDNVRHGLNRDLGFTEQDRAENIRRIAETSKLMMEAGVIVIASFISPFKSEREMAKDIIGNKNFIEVHIDTPLDVAEKRDVKGLYKKARSGEIPNFTGIGSPYEEPETPDIKVKTDGLSPQESTEQILKYLQKNNII